MDVWKMIPSLEVFGFYSFQLAVFFWHVILEGLNTNGQNIYIPRKNEPKKTVLPPKTTKFIHQKNPRPKNGMTPGITPSSRTFGLGGRLAWLGLGRTRGLGLGVPKDLVWCPWDRPLVVGGGEWWSRFLWFGCCCCCVFFGSGWDFSL